MHPTSLRFASSRPLHTVHCSQSHLHAHRRHLAATSEECTVHGLFQTYSSFPLPSILPVHLISDSRRQINGGSWARLSGHDTMCLPAESNPIQHSSDLYWVLRRYDGYQQPTSSSTSKARKHNLLTDLGHLHQSSCLDRERQGCLAALHHRRDGRTRQCMQTSYTKLRLLRSMGESCRGLRRAFSSLMLWTLRQSVLSTLSTDSSEDKSIWNLSSVFLLATSSSGDWTYPVSSCTRIAVAHFGAFELG